MRVLKFGGSSLADGAAIAHVAWLMREHGNGRECVLVCSACAGVTNQLAQIVALVREGLGIRALAKVRRLRTRHRSILASIKPGTAHTDEQFADRARMWNELESLGAALRASVAGTAPRDADAAWADSVLAYGERASARLVARALRSCGVCAEAIDAMRFLVTDGNFQNAAPLWGETRRRGRDLLLPLLKEGIVPVVTGFIGATLAGEITTLGRNSSDFSAAIVGDVLDAHEVCIWTDVDGLFDGDPRRRAVAEHDALTSTEVTLLNELTYDEALRLADNGAKVLHPSTIDPLREKNITLRIRNTFRPEHPGTRIGGRGDARPIAKHSSSLAEESAPQ